MQRSGITGGWTVRSLARSVRRWSFWALCVCLCECTCNEPATTAAHNCSTHTRPHTRTPTALVLATIRRRCSALRSFTQCPRPRCRAATHSAAPDHPPHTLPHHLGTTTTRLLTLPPQISAIQRARTRLQNKQDSA